MTAFEEMSVEDRKLHIELQYIVQPKDKELEEKIDKLTKNAERCKRGGGSKERILLVIGASDTGKSTALARIFRNFEAFQPKQNEHGDTVRPLLSMDCPSSCSPKTLAAAILDKWNLYAKPRASASEMWSMIKRQLREREILYLHLDEMQHVSTGETEDAIRDVQDFIKSLTQIDGWPLHLILSGMPDQKRFMDSDEIANRADVQRFELVKATAKNVEAMDKIVRKIVLEHAGLEVGWSDDDQVIRRLMVASKNAFASMIVLTRHACFRVLDRGETTVKISDFAAAYKTRRGNLKGDNPLTSEDWKNIDPSNSLSDMDVQNGRKARK